MRCVVRKKIPRCRGLKLLIVNNVSFRGLHRKKKNSPMQGIETIITPCGFWRRTGYSKKKNSPMQGIETKVLRAGEIVGRSSVRKKIPRCRGLKPITPITSQDVAGQVRKKIPRCRGLKQKLNISPGSGGRFSKKKNSPMQGIETIKPLAAILANHDPRKKKNSPMQGIETTRYCKSVVFSHPGKKKNSPMQGIETWKQVQCLTLRSTSKKKNSPMQGIETLSFSRTEITMVST